MASPRHLSLVAALAALVGCTSDDASSVVPTPRPVATVPAATAAPAELPVEVLALRGLPVTLPVEADATVVEPPVHGVVTTVGGIPAYRSANGWSGIETMVMADRSGRRRSLSIDVDRNAGLPELVSGARVPRPGTAADFTACDADASSLAPAVSGDGCRVAFVSAAGNLDGADGEGAVFLADRQDGSLVRIAACEGTPLMADDPWDEDVASVSGSVIALDSAGARVVHVAGAMGRRAVRLVVAGCASTVSVAADGGEADGDSIAPAVDASGRRIAFQSTATNLVSTDGNEAADVFVRDAVAGITTRVSLARDGGDADGPSFAPAFSGDGRFVAFHSLATDLVDGDRNGVSDVFVRDLTNGLTERVSVPDGNVGEADGPSAWASISGDGRWVTFQSWAGNLVADDTNRCCDVFVRDCRTGTTVRISRGCDGAEADGPSVRPVISADGRFVTFLSAAVNLVPGGGDGCMHAYRHDRLIGQTRRIDQSVDGQPAPAECSWVRSDAAGRIVVFTAPVALVPEVMRVGMMNVYAATLPLGVIN